jgi:hypothetical protein
MNIALILFTLGVIMVVAGYTNQVSPHCNTKLKVKVVPRGVYDEILYNQELTESVYNDMILGEGEEGVEEEDEGITIE